jgi:hypothetical protein
VAVRKSWAVGQGRHTVEVEDRMAVGVLAVDIEAGTGVGTGVGIEGIAELGMAAVEEADIGVTEKLVGSILGEEPDMVAAVVVAAVVAAVLVVGNPLI